MWSNSENQIKNLIIFTKCKSENECRLHPTEPTASMGFTLRVIKNKNQMKNRVLILVIMLSFIGYGQEKPLVEKKTTVKGYWHGTIDSLDLGNRTRYDLAEDDVYNELVKRGGGIGYIQPPYWEVRVTINQQGDTIRIVEPLERYSKDTTVWGWSKIRLNNLRRIVFTHRLKEGGFRTTHLKVLDTTIFKSCAETDFCSKDSMQFKIKYDYVGDNVLLNSTELGDIDLEPDFKIDSTFADIIESNRFKLQVLATKQNQILAFTLILEDGTVIDYPQDDAFNATNLGNGLFRHGRYIDNLDSNTNYKFKLTIKSEFGTIRKTPTISFKTL